MSPQTQAFVFFGALAIACTAAVIGIIIGDLRGGPVLAAVGVIGVALCVLVLVRGYRNTRTKG